MVRIKQLSKMTYTVNLFCLLLFLVLFSNGFSQDYSFNNSSDCEVGFILPIMLSDSVFSIVDPSFNGELSLYVEKKLIIPQEILKNKKYSIFIHIDFNSNGEVLEANLVREIGECSQCSELAFDLIRIMPRWNPAFETLIDGTKKNFNSDIIIEISFSPIFARIVK